MATPLRAYELLRRAMQPQCVKQQGDDWNSTGLASNQNADGDQAPQGLLGRLLALQAEQSRYQPVDETDAPAPAQPYDPNFRQLSRVSQRDRQPVANGPSSPSAEQSSQTVPQPVGGLFGAFGGSPGSPWFADAPTRTPLPAGPRWPGAPMPPMGSMPSLPPVSMPAMPEAWKTAWKLLQLYPRVFTGAAEDDEECAEEMRKAREICTEAYANGWKSDHDVGPYDTAAGDSWSIPDCVRGLLSERCGGNPVEKEPNKDARKKRR